MAVQGTQLCYKNTVELQGEDPAVLAKMLYLHGSTASCQQTKTQCDILTHDVNVSAQIRSRTGSAAKRYSSEKAIAAEIQHS